MSLKYNDGTVVPLPVKVYSSLGAGQWARVLADPIDATSPDGTATVNWEGADISAKFGSTTSYTGALGALSVEGNGARIESTPVELEGSFKQGKYAFSESESSVALDRITLTKVD